MGILKKIKKFFHFKVNYLAEVKKYLKKAHQTHQLDPGTLSLIEGSMNLMDLRVEDVMIPKSNMISLKINDSADAILQYITESSHSRFPVFDLQGRAVQGVLLAKDLLTQFKTLEKQFSLRELLRPPFHVPLSRRLHHLLNDFRRNHTHLATVIDEHGVCVGIITIEDVLEQIVGEIEDEHDSNDEPLVFDHGHDRIITVKALIRIDDFNASFNTNFDNQDFDTLSGFISNAFGYLPKKGESIMIDGLLFTILRADSRKIYLIKVHTKLAEEVGDYNNQL